MELSNSFYVVVFKKENNMDVVPSAWLYTKDQQTYSYWPKCKVIEEVHLAARDQDPPNPRTWSKYLVRVLGHGFSKYWVHAKYVNSRNIFTSVSFQRNTIRQWTVWIISWRIQNTMRRKMRLARIVHLPRS